MNLPEIFDAKWEKSLQFKACPEEMKDSMRDAFIEGYLFGVEAGLQILCSEEEE